MRNRWTTAAVACIAAATIAGCGGSDSSSGSEGKSTPTTAANGARLTGSFRQQAHQICSGASAEVARLRVSADQTPDEGIKYANDRAEIQVAAARQLAGLDAPEDQASTVTELSRALKERSLTLEATQIKLENQDQTITNQIEQAKGQMATVARLSTELGLPACNW